MLVPEGILQKPDSLTSEEFEEMKLHTVYGGDLLLESKYIDESVRHGVANIAYQHHERYDGTGYPQSITHDDVDDNSVVVGISDVYDAMTSKRVYRDPSSPYSVTKDLFYTKGTQFHSRLVDEFIKCIGIYPIGSYVKLSTGERAEVKSVNRGNLLQPKVTVVLDKECKRDVTSLDIDLNKERDIKIIDADN